MTRRRSPTPPSGCMRRLWAHDQNRREQNPYTSIVYTKPSSVAFFHCTPKHPLRLANDAPVSPFSTGATFCSGHGPAEGTRGEHMEQVASLYHIILYGFFSAFSAHGLVKTDRCARGHAVCMSRAPGAIVVHPFDAFAGLSRVDFGKQQALRRGAPKTPSPSLVILERRSRSVRPSYIHRSMMRGGTTEGMTDRGCAPLICSLERICASVARARSSSHLPNDTHRHLFRPPLDQITRRSQRWWAPARVPPTLRLRQQRLVVIHAAAVMLRLKCMRRDVAEGLWAHGQGGFGQKP
ncbi:hypothetical protein B0H14DRAFT_66871 [Mycena olivaceomarginata]|nr:hypothetical protein B0H14DRAFT_66871 [Mycena olivaceomarginata]